MKIQTFISFPSARIACYIVFCVFAHTDVEDVYCMAFFKHLKFFLSLLWVVERVFMNVRGKIRKKKKYIRRNRNSGKVSKKMQEKRDGDASC